MSFHLRPLAAFNLSPAAHNSRMVPVCAEARAGTTFPDAHSVFTVGSASLVFLARLSSCVLVSAEEKWWKDKNGSPLTVYMQTLAIASRALINLCCPTSSTNGVVISVRSRWESGVSDVLRGSQSPHAWAAEQHEEHLSDSRQEPGDKL